MKTIKTSIASLMSLVTILLLVGLVWASPANWTETTRFTGSVSQDTDYFTCTHAEWRINWTYTPNPDYPQFAGFILATKDNQTRLVSYIYQSGNDTTSGLTYVHNKIGQFYLAISATNLIDYTIIIEQDLDSIPEFPLGPVFVLLTATLFIAVLARRPS